MKIDFQEPDFELITDHGLSVKTFEGNIKDAFSQLDEEGFEVANSDEVSGFINATGNDYKNTSIVTASNVFYEKKGDDVYLSFNNNNDNYDQRNDFFNHFLHKSRKINLRNNIMDYVPDQNNPFRHKRFTPVQSPTLEISLDEVVDYLNPKFDKIGETMTITKELSTFNLQFLTDLIDFVYGSSSSELYDILSRSSKNPKLSFTMLTPDFVKSSKDQIGVMGKVIFNNYKHVDFGTHKYLPEDKLFKDHIVLVGVKQYNE